METQNPNNNAKPNPEPKILKKAPRKSPVDQILNTFRRIYTRQLKSSWELKHEALKMSCDAYYTKHLEGYNDDSFHSDVAKRVDILLSSKHFVEECENKQINAYAAATHFALTGWQNVADYVLRRELSGFNVASEWQKPMFEYNRLVSLERHIAAVCPPSNEA